MRDYGAFSSKTFCVLSFFLKVGERDEEWEVCVLVAGLLEIFIELLLDVFP